MSPADVFLRWLSERREGPWEAVREAARWWFADTGSDERSWLIAERLSDLGHIDVDWGARRWSASPAVVNILPPGAMVAVMCGARTAALTDRVADIADSSSGPDVEVQMISQADGPAVWAIAGHRKDLVKFAKDADAALADDAADAIAQRLPSITSSIGYPSNVLGGAASIRVFDADRLDFQPARDALKPGLYQLAAAAGPRFVYSPLPGRYHELDRSIGIYAELARRSVHVVHYAKGDMWVPRWLPPPPAHRRSLVLCSGFLPRVEGSFLRYEAVPKSVADRVAGSLGQALLEAPPSRPGGQPRK